MDNHGCIIQDSSAGEGQPRASSMRCVNAATLFRSSKFSPITNDEKLGEEEETAAYGEWISNLLESPYPTTVLKMMPGQHDFLGMLKRTGLPKGSYEGMVLSKRPGDDPNDEFMSVTNKVVGRYREARRKARVALGLPPEVDYDPEDPLGRHEEIILATTGPGNAGAGIDDSLHCAGCHSVSHKLHRCPNMAEDGLIHGCILCNTLDHETPDCVSFPVEMRPRYLLLVSLRQNMPSVFGCDWYTPLCWFNKSFGQHAPRYPWTQEFGKLVVNAPNMMEQIRRAIDEDNIDLRPQDPSMCTLSSAQSYWAKKGHPEAVAIEAQTREAGAEDTNKSTPADNELARTSSMRVSSFFSNVFGVEAIDVRKLV